ncbi:MAG: hypothetical protein AB1403_01675 [Candidatus Riflebacteria bacterium]
MSEENPGELTPELTPELAHKLQDIKDRCMPPVRFSYRAFYVILLFFSLITYVSHRLVADQVNWDSLRYSHGLLPLDVLMMRNAMVPWLLPTAIMLFFALSFKFHSLRSPAFLAWFTLAVFGLAGCYIWVSSMFSFHLLSILPIK